MGQFAGALTPSRREAERPPGTHPAVGGPVWRRRRLAAADPAQLDSMADAYAVVRDGMVERFPLGDDVLTPTTWRTAALAAYRALCHCTEARLE